MFEKLQEFEKEYNHLAGLLSDPRIIADRTEYSKYVKKYNKLRNVVGRFQDYKRVLREIEESKAILGEKEADQELLVLAEEELE
ncbi:PCRF domain-containing protein, partial [candidate division NPL-UPA2 bacterium]|nr:PCRF domain-containing protein [candidate division NPL-UPA2 bacterium]